MKKTCLGAGLGALALIVPTAVQAQERNGSGFYIGLEGGVASVSDADIVYYDVPGTFGGTGSRDTAEGTIDARRAFTVGGAIGYDFGTIRTDIELDFARNKINALTIERINGAPVTLTDTDRAEVCAYLEADSCGGSGNMFVFDGSRVRQLSALANLWLDLPIAPGLVPYAGGGVGIGGFEVDGEGTGKFAWQLGAGIALSVSPVVSLTAEFRHRQIGRSTIEYGAGSGFELDRLKSNAFTAGVRFTF